MKATLINSIEQYNRMFSLQTKHPLVAVAEIADYHPQELVSTTRYGVYAVFLKMGVGCRLRYGCQQYDYQEGSIVCFAPGQTVTTEFQEGEHASWKVLMFHPDLLFDTPLADRIGQYSYFGYDQREALHLSDEERHIIEDTFAHISREMEHAVDHHSQQLLTVYIQLVLDYCLRFYDRQFITRHKANSKLITRFEQLVDDYLAGPQLITHGQPTVAWCASELCLSANYFGDLVRKELGSSAKDFITRKVIDMAKRSLRRSDDPISHVADRLGFSSTSHFIRQFKAQTGQTPTEYRRNIV